MEKKKLKLDISKAISICVKNGVKVYPIVCGRLYKIEVDNNGELLRYDKEISYKELNKAISLTYKHYAIQFIIKERDANSSKEN